MLPNFAPPQGSPRSTMPPHPQGRAPMQPWMHPIPSLHLVICLAPLAMPLPHLWPWLWVAHWRVPHTKYCLALAWPALPPEQQQPTATATTHKSMCIDVVRAKDYNVNLSKLYLNDIVIYNKFVTYILASYTSRTKLRHTIIQY